MELEVLYKLARENSLQDFLKKVEQFNNHPQSPISLLKSTMDKYEAKVFPGLLADFGISPSKFAQVVINEIKRDDKLMDAFVKNPSSLFASILAGAEVGLMPTNGEFFLITRIMNGKLTVTPQIGYKGLIRLLLRSNDIKNIETNIVYQGEKFMASLGTNPNLKHIPKYNIERSSDKITHAYAIAYFKSGGFQFQILTREEINSVSKLSKYNQSLYFNDTTNPNRWMERKCALIQLAKLLDKDFYGNKAIELDNKLEVGSYLTLDENDKVKVVESKPSRFRDIYGTLSN